MRKFSQAVRKQSASNLQVNRKQSTSNLQADALRQSLLPEREKLTGKPGRE
jgi:hypothetical protein